MGSGHFLEEGVGKSSCFRNIQIVDASNNVKVPIGIGTFTKQSNCYDVQTGSNGGWGHSFYYGGLVKTRIAHEDGEKVTFSSSLLFISLNPYIALENIFR
ncbi:hypothetical protein L1049_003839 [Liquidambar formosana]|uniref:Neprosin PEP catalytic domain-containing protein n=1 Tax=Liquidambar formosana TaxID=63359 RepID=A0AAP0RNK4_LIQFO